jgi:hypothetical protein
MEEVVLNRRCRCRWIDVEWRKVVEIVESGKKETEG